MPIISVAFILIISLFASGCNPSVDEETIDSQKNIVKEQNYDRQKLLAKKLAQKKEEYDDFQGETEPDLWYGLETIPTLFFESQNPKRIARSHELIAQLDTTEENKNQMRLILAAGTGNKKEVERLLALGTNPSPKNAMYLGMKPLDARENSIRGGHLEILKILLPYTTLNYPSLLSTSIYTKQTEISLFLLEKLKEKDFHCEPDGNSLLADAASANELKIVQQLLKHPYERRCIIKALEKATESLNADVIDVLLAQLETVSTEEINNIFDKFMTGGIRGDWEEKHPEVILFPEKDFSSYQVAVLEKFYPFYDQLPVGNWREHWWQILKNHPQYLRKFLQLGGDVNYTQEEYPHSIWDVISEKESVQTLLQAGATFHPLAWDNFLQDEDSLKIILNSGAKPTLSALLSAIRFYLVGEDDSWDIDISIGSFCGPRCVHNITTFSSEDYWRPTLHQPNTRSLTTVQLLLEHGAPVNEQDEKGTTPLMFAARGNSQALIKLLLSKGADVNMQDNRGWTALMEAVWFDQLDTVKTLLATGADASLKNKQGLLATDLALQRKNVLTYTEILKRS